MKTCCSIPNIDPAIGYKHSVTRSVITDQGQILLLDPTGRAGTQVGFCPFCGKQATTLKRHKNEVTPREIDFTTISHAGGEIKNRHWRELAEPILCQHSQFGSVWLLATDNAHARVKTSADEIILTVCYENLTLPPKPSTSVRKVGASTKKAQKPKELTLTELAAKYELF